MRVDQLAQLFSQIDKRPVSADAARKTISRPSAESSSGAVIRNLSKTNEASRSKDRICNRVYPLIFPSASNCRSSWKVACLGAKKTKGGPSGRETRAR